MKANVQPSGKEEVKGQEGDNQASKYYPEFLRKAAHPGICIWHMLFKAAAIVWYFFLNLFIDNYVLTFISVILLSAFDFWVVKNITGRILVGLRWWSQVKEDGTEEWYFESLEEKKNAGVDSFIFWAVLYITPIVWAVLACFSVSMPLFLSSEGYIKKNWKLLIEKSYQISSYITNQK